jgi:endonuclease YncB( thermonuclease family)
MVAEGYAIVYRQHGAEYNGLEAQLTAAEKNARLKRLGIWSGNGEFISPSEHKRRHLK